MPSNSVCRSDGGTVEATLTATSTGDNQVFTIDGGPATAGVNNLAAPAGHLHTNMPYWKLHGRCL
jgi:hypothetical protein